MNVVLITQNEPFFLAKNIQYLINNFPEHSKVVSCVVSDVSPFGKKESFLKKALKTYKIFGIRFFLYYSFKFIHGFFNPGNNVFNILKNNNIDSIVLSKSINNEESLEIIRSYNPDLLVSILGNQIFKSKLINLAPNGCLNLHTALLPKYRGLMPTFWVLKNREKFTGVSVFFVDEKIDNGPIIVQKKIKITTNKQAELIRLTKKLGMDSIIEAINKIKNNDYKLIENDEKLSSYYTFPKKEDVRIFIKYNTFF